MQRTPPSDPFLLLPMPHPVSGQPEQPSCSSGTAKRGEFTVGGSSPGLPVLQVQGWLLLQRMQEQPSTHCCSLHAAAQHNVPAPSKGHHPWGTNWHSQLRDGEELAGLGNGTAGPPSPKTALLTVSCACKDTCADCALQGQREGGREAEVLSALSVGAGPHPSQRQTQLCCDLLPCRNVHQL